MGLKMRILTVPNICIEILNVFLTDVEIFHVGKIIV
jgi:hypothetical protein